MPIDASNNYMYNVCLNYGNIYTNIGHIYNSVTQKKCKKSFWIFLALNECP